MIVRFLDILIIIFWVNFGGNIFFEMRFLGLNIRGLIEFFIRFKIGMEF